MGIIRLQSPPHANVTERMSHAEVIGNQAPKSALIQANPPLKTAFDDLATAATDMGKAAATKSTLDKEASDAAQVLTDAVSVYDTRVSVCTSLVEATAKTIAEAESTGFSALVRKHYAFVSPIALLAAFDALKKEIDVQIKPAPGMRSTAVDVSTDPNNPESWKRLEGDGLRHILKGYAPGTYWFRAAHVRSRKISEFTVPISVVVK